MLVGLVIALLVVVIGVTIAMQQSATAPDAAETETTKQNSMEAMDMPAQVDPGATSSTVADDGKVQTGQVKLDIKDYAYSQPNLKIKKGTKVTWTNQDSAQHDVASNDQKAGAPKSELLSKGESYSYTFNAVGEFSYRCSPHPYMKAMVTVVE